MIEIYIFILSYKAQASKFSQYNLQAIHVSRENAQAIRRLIHELQ
jgi:hypothetical protein